MYSKLHLGIFYKIEKGQSIYEGKKKLSKYCFECMFWLETG